MLILLVWFLGALFCVALSSYLDARLKADLFEGEVVGGVIFLCVIWPLSLPVAIVVGICAGVWFLSRKAGERARERT